MTMSLFGWRMGATPRRPRGPDIAGLAPELHAWLHLAAMAPSGHNTQPWRVRVRDAHQLDILRDPARELPAVDPDNRELAISIGAFVESLVLAAGAAASAAEVTVVGADAHAETLVRVDLRRDRMREYPIERMSQRRTLRKHHTDRPLDRATIAALLEPLPRAVFHDATSAPARRLADMTLASNRAQADRDAAQRELAAWMRLDDRDIERERDGLTPASLEIGGIAGAIVRRYERNDILSPSFRNRTVDVVRKQLAHYGGWLVVTGTDDLAGSIATGRELMRSLLLARELGVAIHPMTQALEEAPWRDEVANALDLPSAPRLLLRTSFVERYPAPVSPRRPVAWFAEPASDGAS